MALLRALKTYEGDEGMVRRGDIFEVETDERAELLKRNRLAEDAPEGAEVTNHNQKNAALDDMSKAELEEVAAAENVTYEEGALKEDIKKAILKKREGDYMTEQQKRSAGYSMTPTGAGTVNEAAEADAPADSDGSGNDSGTEGGGA